jgi:hypothetical protein
MQLRRYRKNWHRRPEKVDSSVFVAFWADQKFVSALDADGVEWLLTGKHTLKDIEAGDSGLVRIHRASLVRVEAVEGLTSRNERRKNQSSFTRDHFCLVGGREFSVSRRGKIDIYPRYAAYLGQQELPSAVAA